MTMWIKCYNDGYDYEALIFRPEITEEGIQDEKPFKEVGVDLLQCEDG